MNRTRPRVLIVEDNPDVTYMLSRFFEATGWEAITAGTVAEAVGLLMIEFDLVLLDLMLPDGTGADVLQAVRDRDLAVRVVVSTAADPKSPHLKKARDLAPDCVLFKPAAYDALIALTREKPERFAAVPVP